MFGEKKHSGWQLPNPFRRFPGKQDLRPKYNNTRRSRRRISSVYLPDDSSTSGFVVVPEFDYPVRTQTTHEDPNHLPHPPRLLAAALLPSSSLFSSDSVDNNLYGLEPKGFCCSSCFDPGPYYTTSPDTSCDDRDDLPQRLSLAYEHIRSMPSASSSNILLSSDPQMLRKQLGIPQHSVLNYPVHSSPHLPNPHTLPRESMSPELPSTASPDHSYARTSRKLGLRINTNVYPFFPRRCPPDLSQCAQEKPMRSAPTSTEKSLSQRGDTLEATWSAHHDDVYETKPQSFVPSSSKLVKRRVKKPAITSSLPSSRRRALKAVFRKPVADTPSPPNVHEWQISLPQVRPPSPFRVDIPLLHTWHDRRTNFNSYSECRFKTAQFQETSSQRCDGSTEILASLAWIGTPPMKASSYTINRGRHLSGPPLFDRLSMAVAVEDDSISDDALVDRLEKVRRIGILGRGKHNFPSRSPECAREEGDEIDLRQTANRPAPSRSRDVLLPSHLITQDTISDSESAEVWNTARKALLCIREIIRTEKKYQEAIKMLLNAQTATPPPPTMVPYVSALVRTSETLLKSLIEDPSAWGVSTAFVTSEDELETTMVSWCAVAGAFFMDGNDPQYSGLIGRWRHRKSGVHSPSSSMTQQMPVSVSPRHPPMFPIIGPIGGMRDQDEEECDVLQHPPSEQERQTIFHSLHQPRTTENQTQSPSRKLSVRDLAIQPIQRVMRYVLLYRDLLDCTPSISPSHLLVERAVEAATRIADHCDSAQSNPAFFRAS